MITGKPTLSDRARSALRRLWWHIIGEMRMRGWPSPPNDFRGTGWYVTERNEKDHMVSTRFVSAMFLNDAFEIGIAVKWEENGHVDEGWKIIERTEDFRRIAAWYLWRWAWGEWFGLRRKLYYWNLHRSVKAWEKNP